MIEVTNRRKVLDAMNKFKPFASYLNSLVGKRPEAKSSRRFEPCLRFEDFI